MKFTLIPSASKSSRLRWVFPTFEAAIAEKISERFHLTSPIGRVLAARGWQADDACDRFLKPLLGGIQDPLSINGMEAGIERTVKALKSGEQILVFGDYDVDGISATAIMKLTLEFLGAEPLVFLPDRLADGYGMHAHQIDSFADGKIDLIITVDTGITANEAILRAQSRGIDVIVTDHHLPGDELPEAIALINPSIPGSNYAGGAICGAGVAFKFAHALLKAAHPDQKEAKEFLCSLLDFVALGTIADSVPLFEENRIFARAGLEALSAKNVRPGIKALIDVAKISEPKIRTHHIGFGIAPRINATGRLAHPQAALELLLNDSPKEAKAQAEELDTLNRERRNEEARSLEHALNQVEELYSDPAKSHALVVEGEHYHIGVVGIVAARVSERFFRPSIALRRENGSLKGSARSIPGLDIHALLCQCEDLLTKFGGHAQAAGLELPTEHLDQFRERLNALACAEFEKHQFTPSLEIDAVLEPGEWSWKVYEDLNHLEPFGQENREPIFCLRGASSMYEPRLVGKNHLKLSLQHGSEKFNAIGFNLGEYLPICSGGMPLDIVGKLKTNEWQGRVSLELQVLDLRPAE